MPSWFEEYIKEEKDNREHEREREEMKNFREDVMKNMDEKKNILINLTDTLTKNLK